MSLTQAFPHLWTFLPFVQGFHHGPEELRSDLPMVTSERSFSFLNPEAFKAIIPVTFVGNLSEP